MNRPRFDAAAVHPSGLKQQRHQTWADSRTRGSNPRTRVTASPTSSCAKSRSPLPGVETGPADELWASRPGCVTIQCHPSEQQPLTSGRVQRSEARSRLHRSLRAVDQAHLSLEYGYVRITCWMVAPVGPRGAADGPFRWASERMCTNQQERRRDSGCADRPRVPWPGGVRRMLGNSC